MISDVLFEAISKMEEYQRCFPERYDSTAKEIALVKTAADSLRLCLDLAPGVSRELEGLQEQLRTALQAVDLSDVVAARDRLLAGVRNMRRE